MIDRAVVRRAFDHPREFTSSPLYRALSRTVVDDERLLGLASRGTAGQYPTFLFFGAIHLLLLAGADHPLARFYPSVVGAGAAAPDEAGPALVSFCETYEAELAGVISTRLVQTNHVQRALGLRIGLAAIAPEIPAPLHLVEVGASAGLNLRFDRYGYRVGNRVFGDPASEVQIVADAHGPSPVPDLDALPAVASSYGVDLHPIDPRDANDRAWLEALIWPENQHQRAMLAAALRLVGADPVTIHAGDAIDVLPVLADSLPVGEPRVVFHSATRLHVPADRRDAFDDAILACARTGPLWWLSVEDAPDAAGALPRAGTALGLRAPDGKKSTLAVLDGHLGWVQMLPGSVRDRRPASAAGSRRISRTAPDIRAGMPARRRRQFW